jgi:hypothetical protein
MTSYLTSGVSLLATSAVYISGANAILTTFCNTSKITAGLLSKVDAFVTKGTVTRFCTGMYQTAEVFYQSLQKRVPILLGKPKETAAPEPGELDVKIEVKVKKKAKEGPNYVALLVQIVGSVALAAICQIIANRFTPHDVFNQRALWVTPLNFVNGAVHPAAQALYNLIQKQ